LAAQMAHAGCQPQPGDLIEIDRPLYQHWALYVGDGYVINVTGKAYDEAASVTSTCSSVCTTAKVKKELLIAVVGNDKWRVNNKYDGSHTPLPVEEIIRNAEQWIDREVPYDLFTRNCEHFVTKFRYGVELSDQVS
ncbi:PA216 protein, partial [Spelaeornis formosus]|nr:PA216 protein [Elachura formosa]